MAVRFRKGIDWDSYGIDILKYEYLQSKGGTKKNAENFINTDELRAELQKEGVDKNAVRRKYMGLE